MRDDVKKRWVDKLRSGELKQGMGALRERHFQGDDTYCCLGVLCEIAVEDGVLTRQEPDEFHTTYLYGNGEHSALLPPEVAEWTGIDDDPGVPYDGVQEVALTAINDSFGLSFNQIADLIEEHL